MYCQHLEKRFSEGRPNTSSMLSTIVCQILGLVIEDTGLVLCLQTADGNFKYFPASVSTCLICNCLHCLLDIVLFCIFLKITDAEKVRTSKNAEIFLATLLTLCQAL